MPNALNPNFLYSFFAASFVVMTPSSTIKSALASLKCFPHEDRSHTFAPVVLTHGYSQVTSVGDVGTWKMSRHFAKPNHMRVYLGHHGYRVPIFHHLVEAREPFEFVTERWLLVMEHYSERRVLPYLVVEAVVAVCDVSEIRGL